MTPMAPSHNLPLRTLLRGAAIRCVSAAAQVQTRNLPTTALTARQINLGRRRFAFFDDLAARYWYATGGVPISTTPFMKGHENDH